MPKYNRKIVVAMSDTHGGSTLGLCNPETEIQDDEGKTIHPELNEPQKYLWEVYTKGIQDCISLAGKDEIVVIHTGDSTHGDVHFEEVIGSRIADQIFIAVYNFLPWLTLKNVKSTRLIKGTGVHSLGEGSSDILIAKILKERTKKDVRSLYHDLVDIDGVTFDCSHHGPPPGKRPWLRGNEARFYLRAIMMDEINSGEKPPRVVLRGHYHSRIKETIWMDTFLGEVESTLCIVPPLCLLGDYGRKATQSTYRVTNGMLAFEIIHNKLVDTYFYGQTLDIRTKETL